MSIESNVAKTRRESFFQIAAIVLLAGMFLLAARNFFLLPENVPIHFNLAGEADAWGSRWTVWLLPFIALSTYFLLVLVQKFPQYINYPVRITKENARRQFLLVRHFISFLNFVIVLMFAMIQIQLLRMAQEKSAILPMPLFLPLLLALVFIPIGVYFYFSHRLK